MTPTMTTVEVRDYLIGQAALATARRANFRYLFPLDAGTFDSGVLQGIEDTYHEILVKLFGESALEEAISASLPLYGQITEADFEPNDL